ncbi:hypothetical protein CXF95_25620 [Paraglaciecola sp. MB-3u-78]|nr:hypothetical protein CXF95_25620 [Paraglaciecola sp. MB-3u-78]
MDDDPNNPSSYLTLDSELISAQSSYANAVLDISSPEGDRYVPSTGQISLNNTDVSIPGNFNIPVQFSRWVPDGDYHAQALGDWDINIPFIQGKFMSVRGSISESPKIQWGIHDWHGGFNCSGSAETVVDDREDLVYSSTYWTGKLRKRLINRRTFQV